MSRTLLALALIAAAVTARANFVVDDFTSAGMGPFNSSSATSAYATGSASVFGGTRTVQWTKRNAVSSSWGVDTATGLFYGDNGTGADVYLATYYGVTLDASGNRYVGDNNWDFSSVTASTSTSRPPRLWATSRCGSTNGTGGPVGAGRDYGYRFSTAGPAVATISLTDNILGSPGTLDITKIDGFRVAFDVTGSRFEIDRIEAIGAVPEPASLGPRLRRPHPPASAF